MNTLNFEMQNIKSRLLDTWTAGDWGTIARGLQASAETFFDDMSISPDERVLDVACGDGQLAIPAARIGADAVGLDIAEPWIEQARVRAAAEGLDVQFDVGDAEAMPYDDGSFDVVLSLIGAMFAPRPEIATTEMFRVCRPGGRVIMGNWTPEGLIGDFFRTIGQYAPPPDMPSPLLWGTEDAVRERFDGHASDLRMKRRFLTLEYPMPPGEMVEHYVEYFGPTRKAAESLDKKGRKALREDLEKLWSGSNRATGGTTRVDGEILEIVAVRG